MNRAPQADTGNYQQQNTGYQNGTRQNQKQAGAGSAGGSGSGGIRCTGEATGIESGMLLHRTLHPFVVKNQSGSLAYHKWNFSPCQAFPAKILK